MFLLNISNCCSDKDEISAIAVNLLLFLFNKKKTNWQLSRKFRFYRNIDLKCLKETHFNWSIFSCSPILPSYFQYRNNFSFIYSPILRIPLYNVTRSVFNELWNEIKISKSNNAKSQLSILKNGETQNFLYKICLISEIKS